MLADIKKVGLFRVSVFFIFTFFLWICYTLYSSDLSYQHNLELSSSSKMASSLVPPQAPPSWTDTPEQILEKTNAFLAEAKKQDDEIASLENPTIENLIKPFAQWENERFGIINHLTFYQHVSPNPDLRNASTEAETKIDEYSIESGLREDVFKNIKKVYEDNKDNDALDPETKRYISKLYNAYKRNGLDLPKETRAKVEAVSKELSELSIKYNKNLGEQTEYILFTKEELEGVPADVLAQFETVEDGKLKVTFKYPDIIPTLKYSKNPETRKRAFLGDQNKVPENAKILTKAVAKRAELAHLLGYETYSDYVLEESMAKTSQNVLDFENDLLSKLKSKAEAEIKLLQNLKQQDFKSQGLDTKSKNASTYYIWDHSFYNNKLLQEEYQVDEQKISEYFPLQSTVDKMLKFYETLFNLKFEEVTDESKKSVWHEDVKQISVWKLDDPAKPEFMGWIYFDLHPRDGKYGHAAEFGLAPGYFDETTNSKKRPVCSLVCNFSKSTKTKPSLLKHSEVTTFFHELGHGIHELMGDVHYARFHGTNVNRDFVEAPSQMLEFWTWTPAELKKLSSHYITGDPLDDQLIESLVKSKHVNGGLANLRQLHFGLFDMTLHNSKDGKVDVDAAWNDLREKITLLSVGGQVTRGYGSFGHMMGGYAAGYYGYLYSEVFATDMYYTLFKDDPMNTKNGIRYRDIVLKRGGSRDELDNLEELLGRKPNSDAFLKEIGVSK